MKLILQKDVKNLGKAGDQVLVKKGYARNFLIPKGQALPLNKDRLKVWKHQKVIIEAKKRKAIAERKFLIAKLSSIKLKFEKESQKDGRLFGSVTAHEISQTLEKLHNVSVDKKDISVTALKTAGNHIITIRLDSENKTDITVSIKGKVTKKRKQEYSRDNASKESEKETQSEEKSVSFFQKAKMAISLKSKKTEASNETLATASAETSEENEKPSEKKQTLDDIDKLDQEITEPEDETVTNTKEHTETKE